MKTSVFFRSMASSAIFFLFVSFSNGQDQISGNGNDPDKPGMTLSAKAGNIVPQLVDESNNPIFPSLFVEPDGTAHLVYVANDKLMYAKRTRQTDWEYRTLGVCIGCLENDMVLDKNGSIHIVISDTRNSYPLHRLFHFRLTSGGQLSRRILGYDNGENRAARKKAARPSIAARAACCPKPTASAARARGCEPAVSLLGIDAGTTGCKAAVFESTAASWPLPTRSTPTSARSRGRPSWTRRRSGRRSGG